MQQSLLSATVFAFLAATAAGSRISSSSQLRRQGFTINDKVYVDGALFSEGAALEDNLFCHPHAGTSSFKVCGCGVRVVAHLLSECEPYKLSEEVGHCDCGNSACDEKTLTSGYTDKFEWKATSFKIEQCKSDGA
eukprot:CAMPEP_0171089728 /NCGR_PEP_ID=MMETSP0766_2-20121228/27304_1 /TAXON_ID=439317 /ORGANISM="Gambierdiscus australes, Strain CAWD 149" /LENGTH=134 /DNA_ID=CAMNT_0011547631 /DNA_START=54 /DNA_END=458 /DNA_ORIENTATION=+